MTATVPSVRAVRGDIRAWRQARKPANIGAAIAVWGLPTFVAGGLLWNVVGRVEPDDLRSGSSVVELLRVVDPLFAFGLACAAFGSLMLAARALGPIVVDSAEWFWLHSTPLDRSAALAPRYWASTLFGGVVGLLIARAVSLLAESADSWWWFGAMGTAMGTSVVASGVVAQSSTFCNRVYRTSTVVLVGVGVGALCCSMAGTYRADLPDSALMMVTAVAGAGASALAWAGSRHVRRLDSAALQRGSGLLTGFSAAAITLDHSFVSAEIDSRRWRRVGRVRSRSFSGSRTRIFVDADARRVLRDRRALPTLVSMIIAVYLSAAVFALPLRPVVVLLACCVVSSMFGRGLREINSSSAFRASLGGLDRSLRSVHLVVPAVGVLVVFGACLPLVFGGSLWAVLPIPFVTMVALYRSSSRPPLDYGGLILETPMGQIPLDMLRQLLRGPVVVVAFAVVQIAVGLR